MAALPDECDEKKLPGVSGRRVAHDNIWPSNEISVPCLSGALEERTPGKVTRAIFGGSIRERAKSWRGSRCHPE
jgi:hypothetical protein